MTAEHGSPSPPLEKSTMHPACAHSSARVFMRTEPATWVAERNIRHNALQAGVVRGAAGQGQGARGGGGSAQAQGPRPIRLAAAPRAGLGPRQHLGVVFKHVREGQGLQGGASGVGVACARQHGLQGEGRCICLRREHEQQGSGLRACLSRRYNQQGRGPMRVPIQEV